VSSRSKAKYMKVYNRKNRKKIAKRKAAYHRKNRENISKQHAAAYRKNRKKVLKTAAAYRRKNRKKIAKNAVLYRRKNRKQIAKSRAAHYRKNRKKTRGAMHARHACMMQRHKRNLVPRGVKGRPMSTRSHRRKLYYADGRERPCWYCLGENNKCGSGLDRLNNNKTYTFKNTVPACRGCNTWRGATHSVQETRDHFKPMRDVVRRGT
jgi:hypothetical protein